MKKQALLCNGKAVAVGLFLTILLALTARATDAPLVSDAHISSAHPSTNFGSLTNLVVGNGNTALIQFNPPEEGHHESRHCAQHALGAAAP